MKIHIKSNDGFNIKLWLPLAFLKSKLIQKIINKHNSKDVTLWINLLPVIYKSLKKYIKIYGHFILVDVENTDGHKVYIIV